MIKKLEGLLANAGMDTEVSGNTVFAYKDGTTLVASYREMSHDFTAIAVEASVDEVKAAIEGCRLWKTGRYSAGRILYSKYEDLGLQLASRLHVCNHDHSLGEIRREVMSWLNPQ